MTVIRRTRAAAPHVLPARLVLLLPLVLAVLAACSPGGKGGY